MERRTSCELRHGLDSLCFHNENLEVISAYCAGEGVAARLAARRTKTS